LTARQTKEEIDVITKNMYYECFVPIMIFLIEGCC